MILELSILLLVYVSTSTGQERNEDCLETAVSGLEKELPCRAQCTGVGVEWCLRKTDLLLREENWRLCLGDGGWAVEGQGGPNPESLSITDDNALLIHHVTVFGYHNVLATCNILDDLNRTVCNSTAIQLHVIGVLEQFPPTVLAQYPPASKWYQVTAGQSFDLCIQGRSNGVSNTSGANYWEDGRGHKFNLHYYRSNCSSYSCECMLQEARQNKSLVTSVAASYRTSPCLPYDNVFLAVIRFRSLSISDSSVYVLNLKDMNGLGIVNAHYNISVGYKQIDPVFSSPEAAYITERQQDAIHCNVTTSVGDRVQWVGVDLISTTCTDINCICAEQKRTVSYEIYSRLVNSPDHDSATVAVHSVGLALCDTTVSEQKYTCVVQNEGGAILTNNTVTVTVVESNEMTAMATITSYALLLSVLISIIILTLIIGIIIFVMVLCVYMRRQSKKRNGFSNRASSNYYFFAS